MEYNHYLCIINGYDGLEIILCNHVLHTPTWWSWHSLAIIIIIITRFIINMRSKSIFLYRSGNCSIPPLDHMFRSCTVDIPFAMLMWRRGGTNLLPLAKGQGLRPMFVSWRSQGTFMRSHTKMWIRETKLRGRRLTAHRAFPNGPLNFVNIVTPNEVFPLE